MSRFLLQLQLMAFVVVLAWCVGVFLLDSVAAPDTLYLIWFGLMPPAWVVGAIILYRRWRDKPVEKPE